MKLPSIITQVMQLSCPRVPEISLADIETFGLIQPAWTQEGESMSADVKVSGSATLMIRPVSDGQLMLTLEFNIQLPDYLYDEQSGWVQANPLEELNKANQDILLIARMVANAYYPAIQLFEGVGRDRIESFKPRNVVSPNDAVSVICHRPSWVPVSSALQLYRPESVRTSVVRSSPISGFRAAAASGS